jgi:hypothetical protein
MVFGQVFSVPSSLWNALWTLTHCENPFLSLMFCWNSSLSHGNFRSLLGSKFWYFLTSSPDIQNNLVFSMKIDCYPGKIHSLFPLPNRSTLLHTSNTRLDLDNGMLKAVTYPGA